MTDLSELKKELQKEADPKQAEALQRFFKTGKGGYGEGDLFLGIKVPVQRMIAKKYRELSLKDIRELLDSRIHEHRLVALLILIKKYEKGDEAQKKEIFHFYISNAERINNWDLVDLSAPNIVGDYLLGRKKDILFRFARSGNLWKKRISIISTATFIRNNSFDDTFSIAEILLNDKHDLIHKAAGWMLREVGKRDQEKEEQFLKKYCKTMPRTMLRYAIEKFDEKKRRFYMGK